MKTIKISDETYEFIKNLAEQMDKQDNRGTRCPVWCVFHKKENIVAEGYSYDKVVWLNNDYEEVESMDCDDWDDDLADKYDEEYGEDNKRYVELVDEVDLENGNAVFLTEQGYQDYIKRQGYHHEQPFSYVHSAWNNPEIEGLMDMIFEIMGKPIPMAYK